MSPKVNANTVKSRNRYQLLKLIAKVLFPSEKNPSGSTILTQFTQALYQKSPTPEKLSEEEIRASVKEVLERLLQDMNT
jgi:aryl-alcohol dehydrogenase-like predicted oxidoreductase